MTTLVWLHEDALRADHPAIVTAGSDAVICSVWDETYLRNMQYGFKRLAFIYESLCALPVKIYKGDTVEVLQELAQQFDAEYLSIPTTPNPELLALAKELEHVINTRFIDDVPFVQLNKEPDIKRFFRYWNKAKKLAMLNGGGNT